MAQCLGAGLQIKGSLLTTGGVPAKMETKVETLCVLTQKDTNNQSKTNKQPKPQKIKLHETPTTKELKKKSTRTTRQVREWTIGADSEKPWQHSRPWGWGWLPSWVGCVGGADLRGKLSWLWAMAGVAAVGDTPSLTWEFLEKCARDEQVSCTVPSLAPPPQAELQHSKESCPAWVHT